MHIFFLPPGNDLNNREVAAAIWLAALAVALIAWRDFRPFIGRTIKILLNPTVLLAVGTLLAWAILATLIGWRLGLWSDDLIKDTTLWFVAFALVRLFRTNQAADEKHFFRDLILDPIRVSAIVEFVSSLFVFPLVAELFLVPVATVLGLFAVGGNSAFVTRASNAKQAKRASQLSAGCLTVIGLAIVGFSIWQIVATWSHVDWAHQIRAFALPLWLSAATVPYLYLISVLAGYESAFLRVAFASPRRRITLRSRLALITVLGLRIRAVARFVLPWTGWLAEAESLRGARAVVKEYLRSSQPYPAASDT